MEFVTAHGARIPTIGLGTWPMKGQECIGAVAAALEAGYRHIDTAAGYENESEVGEGIRASGIRREDVFVTTKIRPSDLGEGDMQRSVERSLRLLGMHAVDLVLIHWPSRTIPVADTIRSLNGIRRRGLARHIGVSNFTTTLLAEAWAATEEPLAVNQCEYHPRLNQDKVIAAGHEHGMAFTAYSPIGRSAVLADKTVTAVAKRLGRTPAQIILRWLIQQPGIVVIPKSATPARIRENFDIFGFALDPEDMAAIADLAKPNSRIVRDPGIAPAWDN